MIVLKLLYLPIIAVLTLAAPGEPQMVPVPGERVIHLDTNIGSIAPQADEVVRVIVSDTPVVKKETSVFVVDIADSTDSKIINPQSAGALVPGIPANALWPDASGSIIVKVPNSGIRPNKFSARNPWVIAGSMNIIGNRSTISCGGVIIGGIGEGAAIVNGQILRQGDKLESYCVVGIVSTGVLLERDNFIFVIPRGRCITIGLIDG